MTRAGRTFLILWAGQVVSVFGSTLTGFALGVWVYQTTGSVTRFALISFFTLLPGVLILPVVGSIVDRFDRRRVMILSDAGAALGTLAIMALIGSGRLEIWHLYVLMSWISVWNAPQILAFQTAIPVLVPARQLSRANGMFQLGAGVAEIGSPLLAGVLVVSVPLWSILLIDLATFALAIVSLMLIRLPAPATAAESGPGEGGEATSEGLRERLTAGWRYLRADRGLFGLMAYFTTLNFNRGAVLVLITPLVLTMASPRALGVVHALGAAGMVAGGVLMSLWAGPRRRLRGILAATLFYGVVLGIGGLRPNVAIVGAAAFLLLTAAPVSNSLGLAIWQSRIPQHLQGRVFAARRMVISAATPVAQLIAGPLSDHVFEPAMAPGGSLAPALGPVFEVGPGRGVGLMMTLLGVLAIGNAAAGWLYAPLHRLDDVEPAGEPRTEPVPAR